METTADSPPPSTLTVQQVADELGVHYMTAYRYIRLGVLPASRSGRTWVVERSDLDAYRSGTSERTEAAGRSNAPWDERLVRRMLAADDAGAWGVVEAAMASGHSAPDVYTTILVPALRSVGDRWSSGEIDVADEHAASQVARRVVARLGPLVSPRGVRRGVVIVGSTATELHDIPLSIVSDLLRANHFTVIDLGANLPPSSFATAVAATDGVIVAAIGVTTPGQDDEIARTIAALREASDVPILVGGSGVTPERATALGADATAVTSDDVLDAVDAFASSR